MNNILVRAIALCGMLAATTIFLANARRTEIVVTRTAFDTFPMTIGAWQSIVDPPMDEDVLKVLGVDDYLSRVY